MSGQREPACFVAAPKPPEKIENAAAAIFIHGLGDEGAAFQSVVEQYFTPKRLQHIRWVIPNAEVNRDAMETAWYLPSRLSAVPPSRPELEDDEDEDGMKRSRQYIESLIDDLVNEGIPPSRIVLGGFSQGCVMALFIHLTSRKYAGKLGGIYGIAGYLPLPDKYAELREESSLPPKVEDNVPIFHCRGDRDFNVPKRLYDIANTTLLDLGVKKQNLHLHEFPNVGHIISGKVLEGLCIFLERALPPRS